MQPSLPRAGAATRRGPGRRRAPSSASIQAQRQRPRRFVPANRRARDRRPQAEPDAVLLYPQRFAEVMAGMRPVKPGVEESPASLDGLRVGSATAREIGWAARSP
jgi:hypothetical protein